MTTIFEIHAGGLRSAMVMGGIDGVPDLFAALGRGKPVAKQWTSKALLRVDREFQKQTEQADFLDNMNSALLASARV